MKNLIVLIGPSGSGKDTILNKICGMQPSIHKCILTTTRPHREYEQDNIDYHFKHYRYINDVDTMSSKDYVYAQDFMVKPCTCWSYGLAKDEIKENQLNACILTPYALSRGDYTGINVIVFYIAATGKTRLMRQLNREDDPNCHEICRRYLGDEEDFNHLDFDYEIIRNEYDEVGAAAAEILKRAQDKFG